MEFIMEHNWIDVEDELPECPMVTVLTVMRTSPNMIYMQRYANGKWTHFSGVRYWHHLPFTPLEIEEFKVQFDK